VRIGTKRRRRRRRRRCDNNEARKKRNRTSRGRRRHAFTCARDPHGREHHHERHGRHVK
jgi:hypothetical protein